MSTEQKKSGKGCLFYGCLTFVVLALVVVVGGYFGVRYVTNNLVQSYTASAPVTLPAVEMTDEDYAALRERIDAFTLALENGEAYELALTAEDVNGLIARDPEFEPLRNKVYVFIEDGAVRGDVSAPTDPLGELPFLGGLKGRYFNGSLGVTISLENNFLLVQVSSASVNGEPVPQQAIDQMANENLAKDFYNDPESRAQIEKLESIKVEDDTILIRVRERSTNEVPPAETEPVEAPAEPANDAI